MTAKSQLPTLIMQNDIQEGAMDTHRPIVVHKLRWRLNNRHVDYAPLSCRSTPPDCDSPGPDASGAVIKPLDIVDNSHLGLSCF